MEKREKERNKETETYYTALSPGFEGNTIHPPDHSTQVRTHGSSSLVKTEREDLTTDQWPSNGGSATRCATHRSTPCPARQVGHVPLFKFNQSEILRFCCGSRVACVILPAGCVFA